MISDKYKTFEPNYELLYKPTCNSSTENNLGSWVYEETSGYMENKQGIGEYFYTMPNNLNIFSRVENDLNEIESENIKTFLIYFIHVFQSLLIGITSKKQISNFLPSMIMEQEEDSVFLEWIFKDFRVGFSIEENIKESAGYMITNKNL